MNFNIGGKDSRVEGKFRYYVGKVKVDFFIYFGDEVIVLYWDGLYCCW